MAKAKDEKLSADEQQIVDEEAVAQKVYEKQAAKAEKAAVSQVHDPESTYVGPVTLRLLDADEVTVIADVTVQNVQPFTTNYLGMNFQQVREVAPHVWIYRHMPK